MSEEGLLPVDRFLATLGIVAREAKHLSYSYNRLFSEDINADWVRKLDENPELAERLEAFVSRFGRMQDTIADKLLPRWLLALAETPGSQIEVLNRAERLGVIENVEQWLGARKLRNLLVHEYIESEADFAVNLLQAKAYCRLLMNCLSQICEFARSRMTLDDAKLPEVVVFLDVIKS